MRRRFLAHAPFTVREVALQARETARTSPGTFVAASHPPMTLRPPRSSWLALIVLLLPLAACTGGGDDEGGEGGEGGSGTPVDPAECASGMKWTGGDSESPLMHPGGDCIGCHASGEGPTFAVAGTVYDSSNEPLDCFGVAGATVEITDAANQVFTLTTNDAGNFFLRARDADVAMPIHAVVKYNGNEHAMSAAQSTGACNTCHTEQGANGAPGRILIPL